MGDVKHTPGPWGMVDGIKHSVCETSGIKSERGTWVAKVHPINGTGDREEVLANARLIAAAPEMLEALKGLVELGKRDLSNPKYDGYWDFVREAIAKAEGE